MHDENTAEAMLQQGGLREAEAICKGLSASEAADCAAYRNLANAYRKTGKYSEAVLLLEQLLELQPDDPETHKDLGNVLKEQGRFEAAIDAYESAIRLNPLFAQAHINLGLVHHEKGDFDAATSAFHEAIRLDPRKPEAHYNLGISLHEQGQLTAAIASYARALQLKPNYPDAHNNLSSTLLLAGDYAVGWKEYEHRGDPADLAQGSFRARLKMPLWNGIELAKGDKLLLIAEQGLGDTLQFMRYVIPLRNQGIAASLCPHPQLTTLIQESGIDPAPLKPSQAIQVRDGHWMPLLSLPRYLGVGPENPIITTPYIATSADMVDQWKWTMAQERRPIIGIHWQGNPDVEQTNLRGRSLALEAFAPIAARTKATLVSLQHGFGSEQLDTCSFRDRFASCQEEISKAFNFPETAAIIANCDLIVTSDSCVAHLAAGMGKRTWLLLHKMPDWRWGMEGSSSFWYPSMRLFRQKERGNWNDVLKQVAAELQKDS